MLFEFFKRLFGLVDEGSRKRRAEDAGDERTSSIVAPKKHCREREGSRVSRIIYANENDEEEIEYLGETRRYPSPGRCKERANGGLRHEEKCASGACQRTHIRPCGHENSVSRANGRETMSENRANERTGAAAGRTGTDLKYSTLTKTNQLREKQQYGQLLQRFLQRNGQTPKRRQATTEVVDLENCETSGNGASSKNSPESSQRRVREIFSTPATSTPLRWYTPTERRTCAESSGSREDRLTSVVPVRRIREYDTPVSIAKASTTSNKREPSSEPARGSTISGVSPRETPRATSTVNKSDGATSPSQPRSRNCVEIIRTNTLRDSLAARAVMREDFVPRVRGHYDERLEQRLKEAEEIKRMTCLLSKHNRLTREAALEEQLTRSMRLCEAVLDETEALEEEAALPELTAPMLSEIAQALVPHPPNEVLVEGFGLRITRKDIHTLSGLNWLNDEVINFYMNLLIERGTSGNGYPKVHAMNTFFYPKLLSGGHASLKRWTRKIDIFAQDMIVIPIHLGMHWCMSIVDFRDKSIRYFDSMGGANPKCVATLRRYLEDESMDKRKKPFDTSDWKLESMRDIPQQMNGSDCGVFSCMFAEFITANRRITFTQRDMPYFRNKMVYEILGARLL